WGKNSQKYHRNACSCSCSALSRVPGKSSAFFRSPPDDVEKAQPRLLGEYRNAKLLIAITNLFWLCHILQFIKHASRFRSRLFGGGHGWRRRDIGRALFGLRDMRQHKTQYAKQDNKRLPRFGTSNEFELKDYCSEVFRRIQDLKNVDNYEYMQSVFTDQTLKEIISSKKTGCLGPLPRDDRFFIKTLRKSEVKAIIQMLPSYYFHLKRNPASLLSALYGVHVVKPIAGGSKVYFGVLQNIIPSNVNMYRVYDLKGSSRGRPVKKTRLYGNVIYKDPDFDFSFYLDPYVHERLLSQIKSDCEFLETEGVMDYSLCLGVPLKDSCQGHSEVVLYFAIVDIFQNYGMVKHIEHGFKSIWKDSQSMSAVNPRNYSSRFQEFLFRIFRVQQYQET
ncbi:unnamed protein product, partial [Linum tenue]